MADFLGFALILSRIPGKGHSKLITAGLGWGAAEVILSRGILLWVGARGTEFSWIYILKCLESNVLLVSVEYLSWKQYTLFHKFNRCNTLQQPL